MSSQVLAADEVLIANRVLVADEVGGVEGGDESIEKSVEPKTKKLSKSKKSSDARACFYPFKASFTDIWIETEVAYFLRKAIPWDL